MKTCFIAIAAAAGLTALPAAASSNAVPNATANAATKTDAAPAPVVGTNTRYCITQTPTGSRVPRKTCNTLAQWAALGVDPTK